MKAPKISDRSDLTFDEAKTEYVELFHALHHDAPEHGWHDSVVSRTNDRMNFLKEQIANTVCEVKI